MIDPEIETLWNALRAKIEAKGGRAVAALATPQQSPNWDMKTLPGGAQMFQMNYFAVGSAPTVQALTLNLMEWAENKVIVDRGGR